MFIINCLKYIVKKVYYGNILIDNNLFYLYMKRRMNKLENKQIATVRTITGELIGGFLLYGIAFSILYNIAYSAILNRISSDSLILTAIITIILQGITVFCIWRCSIATTFKKRAIDRNDIKTVMKNLIIFTLIICFITALLNFTEVNKKLAIQSSDLMFSETFVKYKYNAVEMAKYQTEKEKIISKTKTKLYTYLGVLEIGLLAVYLGVVPLQKKAILKHTA